MGYKVSSLHLLKVLLEENVAQRNEIMEKTSSPEVIFWMPWI